MDLIIFHMKFILFMSCIHSNVSSSSFFRSIKSFAVNTFSILAYLLVTSLLLLILILLLCVIFLWCCFKAISQEIKANLEYFHFCVLLCNSFLTYLCCSTAAAATLSYYLTLVFPSFINRWCCGLWIPIISDNFY